MKNLKKNKGFVAILQRLDESTCKACMVIFQLVLLSMIIWDYNRIYVPF